MQSSENSRQAARHSTIVNRKVPKRGKSTKARKHLEPAEVAAHLKAAKRSGRYRLRDETAILLCYRHGLRAEELVSLRWAHIDRKGATVTIHRRKGGTPTRHPLRAVDLRILGALRREQPDTEYVFTSERGSPWTTSNFAKIVKRLHCAAGQCAEQPACAQACVRLQTRE